MYSAGTIQELEIVWEKLNKSRIKTDKKTEEVFTRRKSELNGMNR